MPKPARGQARLREHRFSQPYRVYFVTSCAHERQPLLDSDATAAVVFDELRQLEADDASFELIASVVMPDHAHILVRLGEAHAIGDAMRLFRGRAARAINLALGREGPLWQRSFFEHALRPDEPIESVLHYMWHNPSPPGKRFRCRAEVWLWFKSCVTKDVTYFEWLARNPMGKQASP